MIGSDQCERKRVEGKAGRLETKFTKSFYSKIQQPLQCLFIRRVHALVKNGIAEIVSLDNALHSHYKDTYGSCMPPDIDEIFPDEEDMK